MSAAALNYFTKMSGVEIFNLGTGNGISVLKWSKPIKKQAAKIFPITLRQGGMGIYLPIGQSPKKQMSFWVDLLTIPSMIFARIAGTGSLKIRKVTNKLWVVFKLCTQLI